MPQYIDIAETKPFAVPNTFAVSTIILFSHSGFKIRYFLTHTPLSNLDVKVDSASSDLGRLAGPALNSYY